MTITTARNIIDRMRARSFAPGAGREEYMEQVAARFYVWFGKRLTYVNEVEFVNKLIEAGAFDEKTEIL